MFVTSGSRAGRKRAADGLGSFTKAQLNTAVSDGDPLYVGDVTQYTDEMAQDAVGVMAGASLVYVDATPLLARAALTGAITAAQNSNATLLGSFTKAQLDTAVSDGNVLYVGDIMAYTAENARDDIGAALVAGANTLITVDDGADTITIAQLGWAPLTEATTARTLALTDAERYIQFTNAAASTCTIPPNATVAFAIGTVITIEQNGTGAVTWTAGAGVTITGRSATGVTGGRYAVSQVKKVATNTWNTLGDLT